MKSFFFNRCFEKSNLKALIAWSLLNFGERKTLNLVEKLKNLGFMYATQAGISLSLDDLKTPPTKIWLISEAEYQTETTKRQHYRGNLTAVEKFQQLIDTWHRTSELLKQDVIQNFKSTDILNPVYMMAFSGARGNISQVRQLVGMRGLMADPQGQIIDFPIRSNFREGLTLTEYVISCYGARKGLVDTALRTANSGYLTRRLVDVSQHVIIGWMNCGTTRGISVGNMIIENKIILPLQNRLVGRVLAEDINPIAFKNQQISLELASKIAKLKDTILVRSPLTCKHKKFLCQFCYGWSLAYGNLVAMGEAVGVLAAQSIGEPGTQLTMRTFHTGGVFSGGVVDEIRAPFNGFVFFNTSLPGKLIRTSYGKIAFFTKKPGEVLFFSSSFITLKSPSLQIEELTQDSTQKIKFFLPECTILFIRNAGKIYKGQLVAEFSSITDQKQEQIRAEHLVYSENAGQIFLQKKIQLFQSQNSILGKFKKQIDSLWILSGKIYNSSTASPLFLKKGDFLDSATTINQSLGLTTNTGIISSYREKKRASQDRLSYVYKDQIKAKQIVLKQPIQSLFIKAPNYKKFSYFFSLNYKFNKPTKLGKVKPINFYPFPLAEPAKQASGAGLLIEDKLAKANGCNRPLVISKIRQKLVQNVVQEIKPVDILFTPSSLKENIGQFSRNDQLDWAKKNVLYQWFPKIYQTKTSGLLLSSKFLGENYNFDKSLFWLSEESYEIPPYLKNKFARTKIVKAKKQKLVFSQGWNSNETPCFFINNRQFIKKPTHLKTSGFFHSVTSLFGTTTMKEKIKHSVNIHKVGIARINHKYVEKYCFSSFAFTTLQFSQASSGFFISRNNIKWNNFIFLNKKNILENFRKANLSQPRDKISSIYLLSSGLAKQAEQIIRQSKFSSDIDSLQLKTEETLPFNSLSSISFGTKNLTKSFFQRLSFFRKKNKNYTKKEISNFTVNPLFLVKLSRKNKECLEIKQDPFHEFTSHLYQLTSLNHQSKFKVTLNKKRNLIRVGLKFSETRNVISEQLALNKKIELQENYDRNWKKAKLPITFLRKVGLKKSYSNNVFRLFPFLQLFRPQKLRILIWNEKRENRESFLETTKKLKAKHGWVYFPQNGNKRLKKWNKLDILKLNKSGIDGLVFDQQIIFPDYLRLFWPSLKEKGRNINSLKNKWKRNAILPLFFPKREIKQAFLQSFNNLQNKERLIPKTQGFRASTINNLTKKNRQIIDLKIQLGLSSFFLKSGLAKKKKDKLSSWGPEEKKVNKVILSSRENQEFQITLTEQQNFCEFRLLVNFVNPRNNFEINKVKYKHLALHEKKRKNPWIKRNLQLIINTIDNHLDSEKNANKLKAFSIVSLTIKTVSESKKIFGNKLSNVELKRTDRHADLSLFIQSKIKEELLRKKDFEKIFFSKPFNLDFKLNSNIFSTVSNPYNMFLFCSNPLGLGEQLPNVFASQFFANMQHKVLSKTSKINQVVEQRIVRISRPQFLILFRKVKPYSLLDTRQYKKRVYSTNKKEIFFESIFASQFTQQKKTKLFSCQPSHDLQMKRVKPFSLKKGKYKFFDKIVLQRLAISASPLNNHGLHAITTQIQVTQVKRKNFFEKALFLSTYTFAIFFLGNISYKKNRLRSTKETWISTTRPLVFTDFLSPYTGEIAKSHSNSNCIVVTNADQLTISTSLFNSKETNKCLFYNTRENKTSFTGAIDSSLNKPPFASLSSINKPTPFALIGQFIRSGEEIVANNGLIQSGQVIQIEKGKIVLRIAYPLLLSFGSIFHVQHSSFVEKKAQLFTLFYQIVKTGDIVQGIPKIEQLFEARGPLIEGRGTEERNLFASGLSARFWRIYLNYSQKFSNKIAVRKSFEEIQQIIVQEVYMVYQEQGVNLAEKHLEIIVRQMTSFVLVVNPGNTRFLPGEIIPLALVEKANNYLVFLDTISSISQTPYYAQYVPVLFGITKAALRSEGFISAASFQETTRVLSQAAIEKKKDYLRGLKENVVLGRVIPAGTGFPMWRWKKTSFSLLNQKENPKVKLQSVLSRFDAESLDSLNL